MLVLDRTKRPPDIRGLAAMVTQPKPPQAPPNIIRPILLSNQLRGHCACGSPGLSGLGQDPASIAAAVGQAVSDAKHLWDEIQKIFGIGSGRREADVVVPVQNKLGPVLFNPTFAFIDGSKAGTIHPTCAQIEAEINAVNTGEAAWLGFLHNTQWQDGRAAHQAENDMHPFFVSMSTQLQELKQQYCHVFGGPIGGIFTTPEGGTNWAVIGLAAGAAYLLLRR